MDETDTFPVAKLENWSDIICYGIFDSEIRQLERYRMQS